MTAKSIVFAFLVATLRQVISVPVDISLPTAITRTPVPAEPEPGYSALHSPFTSLLLNRPDDVQQVLKWVNDTYNPRRLPTTYALIDPASLSYEELDAFCQQQLLKIFPDGLVHDENGCQIAYECEFDRLRFPPVIFKGKCLNSFCYDEESMPHQCIPTDAKLQLLRYVLPETNEDQQGETTQGGQWTYELQTIITDCSCPPL